MKRIITIIAGVCILFATASSCCTQKAETSVPHKVKDGRIVDVTFEVFDRFYR